MAYITDLLMRAEQPPALNEALAQLAGATPAPYKEIEDALNWARQWIQKNREVSPWEKIPPGTRTETSRHNIAAEQNTARGQDLNYKATMAQINALREAQAREERLKLFRDAMDLVGLPAGFENLEKYQQELNRTAGILSLLTGVKINLDSDALARYLDENYGQRPGEDAPKDDGGIAPGQRAIDLGYGDLLWLSP